MDSILKRLMWSCPTMPSTVLLNTSRFKTAEAARTFFPPKESMGNPSCHCRREAWDGMAIATTE